MILVPRLVRLEPMLNAGKSHQQATRSKRPATLGSACSVYFTISFPPDRLRRCSWPP